MKYERYMYDVGLRKGSDREKQVFCFGYMDGYFDERIYFNYLGDGEKIKGLYDDGYLSGINDRVVDEKLVHIRKNCWIIKLAVYDALNDINREGFSFNSFREYSVHYNDIKNGVDDKISLDDAARVADEYWDFSSKR